MVLALNKVYYILLTKILKALKAKVEMKLWIDHSKLLKVLSTEIGIFLGSYSNLVIFYIKSLILLSLVLLLISDLTNELHLHQFLVTYRVSQGKLYFLNYLWEIEMYKLNFISRRFWTLEMWEILLLQPVFMICILYALYWTNFPRKYTFYGKWAWCPYVNATPLSFRLKIAEYWGLQMRYY
jgi:hypothetical protein